VGLDTPATWSVATQDAQMAGALLRLLGGHCVELPTTDGSRFEIDTDSASLRVIIAEPSAISSHLTLWDSPGSALQPLTSVRFRLAQASDLGMFELRSGSWDLAESIGEVEDAFSRFNGAVLANMSVEHVEVATRRGAVGSFRKPIVRVLGASGSSI
jgi:hypothetical protein